MSVNATAPGPYLQLMRHAARSGFRIGIEVAPKAIPTMPGGKDMYRPLVALVAEKKAGERTLRLREAITDQDLNAAASVLMRRIP